MPTVHLPSDNLSAKALKAMSGDVKSYRLNDPLKWADFLQMPDDLRIAYIKQIREKFGAPTEAIACMLGVSRSTLKSEIIRLGIGTGTGKFDRHWRAEDFSLWAFGDVRELTKKHEAAPTHTAPIGLSFEPSLLPASGVVTYEGDARKALESLARLFGAEPVRISISWDKLPQRETEGAV